MDNQAGSPRGVTEKASPVCLVRIKRDIADFHADPPPGIFIAPEEKDVRNINAIVTGAPGTPHEGGFFHLYLECPDQYPLEPPKVKFMTTDAGRAQFNPHVFKNGYICLSTLNTNGSSWSPAQSLRSLLISIQSLLSEAFMFPDKDSGDHFESIIQHETIRVAVCDTVEACLKESSPFAQTLKDAVLEKFLELYDRYEGVVKSRLHLTGTDFNDPTRMNSGVYQFETLLTRLQDLKAKITKKKEATADAADANT